MSEKKIIYSEHDIECLVAWCRDRLFKTTDEDTKSRLKTLLEPFNRRFLKDLPSGRDFKTLDGKSYLKVNLSETLPRGNVGKRPCVSIDKGVERGNLFWLDEEMVVTPISKE